ncbi:MAG: TRAP transporter substrate-binding protein [Rhodospirillaceae bacterium]|nr:TRAP transporter substrate-binding protein [Rhodospirillaceae bacterium]
MGQIRRTIVYALLPSLAAALFCAFASSAGAEPITLRLHTFNSPKSIAVRLFLQPWAEEIEQRSEDRVEVQVFPAMQLGGRPSDLYGQARDGVVDIVWTLPGYSAGRFPLTEAFELPFVCGDAEATSQALNEFHREWLQDEYKDTRPLVFHAAAPGHIHTTDRPVRRLEDLEGMKMRTPSRASAAMLEALGAVPIGMPIPRVYEALSRGVVEGAWIPWTIMRPFRLHEVTQHHTEVSLSCVLFLMTMNKARYGSLPADIRTIVDETTGMALAKRLGRLWQDDEEPGRAVALEQGDSIFPLAEAERERWRTATQPVIDRWVEKVNAMGHDGEAMLADARRLVAKYGNEVRR